MPGVRRLSLGDMKRRIATIFGGCFIAVFILAALLYGVSAVIGLITGEIYLPDKRGHGSTLHGAPARIASLIILIIFAFVLPAVWRAFRSSRGVHRRADVMREVQRREGTDADDEGAS